jgi:hypothetical protein
MNAHLWSGDVRLDPLLQIARGYGDGAILLLVQHHADEAIVVDYLTGIHTFSATCRLLDVATVPAVVQQALPQLRSLQIRDCNLRDTGTMSLAALSSVFNSTPPPPIASAYGSQFQVMYHYVKQPTL